MRREFFKVWALIVAVYVLLIGDNCVWRANTRRPMVRALSTRFTTVRPHPTPPLYTPLLPPRDSPQIPVKSRTAHRLHRIRA